MHSIKQNNIFCCILCLIAASWLGYQCMAALLLAGQVSG
jgi:hypothetical protein